jgi:hypothetical protein
MFIGGLGGEGMKIYTICHHLNSFEVICYFSGFPDDVGMVGPCIGCDLYSLEINAVFCFFGVFGYC